MQIFVNETIFYAFKTYPDINGNTQGLVWEPIPPPLAVHWLGTGGGTRYFKICLT